MSLDDLLVVYKELMKAQVNFLLDKDIFVGDIQDLIKEVMNDIENSEDWCEGCHTCNKYMR
ncbi:MAG TPA: hypothetical protein DDY71_09890 [Spirochaetia bacterium]|nr:hypothetical protein [Spirochaetia bacterium]